ncbi:hypothetical protein T12_14486, partial [Trichinella patagoniensis]
LHPRETAVRRVHVTAGVRAGALHLPRERSTAHLLTGAEALALGPKRNAGKPSEKVLITAGARGGSTAGAPQVQEGRELQLV